MAGRWIFVIWKKTFNMVIVIDGYVNNFVPFSLYPWPNRDREIIRYKNLKLKVSEGLIDLDLDQS